MRSRLLVSAAGLIIWGCSSPPSTPPAEPLGDVQVLPLGPLTYFQAHCARCHGPYGVFYPEPFKSDSATLVTRIDEMARGPGDSPLDAANLAAQVAFHRVMRAGGVFLSLTSIEDGLVRGEVSVGAEVVIVGPWGRTRAEVDGHLWKCRIDDVSGPWMIEGHIESQRSTLNPRNCAYSVPGGGG